ncbi:NYN domain-containing protein [Lusitaniella coriacea LEGE 07167]|nr:NYN domain-containing protein [Lusitaniella coriacea]
MSREVKPLSKKIITQSSSNSDENGSQGIQSFSGGSYWQSLDAIARETRQSHEDREMLNTNSCLNRFNCFDRGRVAIFIDGANLFYAALQLGIEINYTFLLHYLTSNSRLLRSFFYTGVDPKNEKQQSFLLWMRRNGYRVVAKDIAQFPDGSKKANLDVEIAVDMMTLVDHYDTAVLVSGDGDLSYVVNAVSYKGARVEVVSLRSMTSDSLINCADYYTDLDLIKEKIQKSSSLR